MQFTNFGDGILHIFIVTISLATKAEIFLHTLHGLNIGQFSVKRGELSIDKTKIVFNLSRNDLPGICGISEKIMSSGKSQNLAFELQMYTLYNTHTPGIYSKPSTLRL